MKKLPTGEPYAGKPHVRFGGRGGRKAFSTPINLPVRSRSRPRSSPRRCVEIVVFFRMLQVSDPILIRFRAALADAFGERVERVVLFGSRACGEARPDSDYDVAVFLKDFAGLVEEMGPIAEIETDILRDTGAVINALPLRASAYRERTGLMAELRREGRDL
jgi:uncharacterized protein